MSKFTIRKPTATVSTASLPDIVIMMHFFIMVVTVFRDQQLLLRVDLPRASQVQKLRHRSLISEIYIGQPREAALGASPAIQINDAFIRLDQVQVAVRQLVTHTPEDQRGRRSTSLKVDQMVDMGIVGDVKTELRKAEQYQLHYVALPAY